jgi:glycosyltransferase involved in cell wall biosynthesis
LPQVATIHDVQHVTFPEYFSPAVRVWRDVRYGVTFRACRRLIAISRFTQQELLEHFAVDASRVTCVHSGVTPATIDSGAVAAIREKVRSVPFFYYPAMGTPHKNHKILFRAMRSPAAGANELHLVLTGRGREAVMREAQEAGVADRVIHLGFVANAEVQALLRSCRALVYPSRYEGFGLPILEAHLARTPVIASDIPVIREVAGSAAALFVHVDDASAWALAMRLIDTNDAERMRLIRAGEENSRRFSWEACARGTLAVLKSAVYP